MKIGSPKPGRCLLLLTLCLLGVSLLLLMPGPVRAADDAVAQSGKKQSGKKQSGKQSTGAAPAAKKKEVPTPKEKKLSREDALAEWDRLESRRRKLRQELRDLQAEFSISSRKRKLEIKKEFEEKLKEWTDDIKPKMQKLAFLKLEADPTNELALGFLEESHDYDRVAEVLERIIKAGKASDRILKLAVSVHFSIHNFDRALELAQQLEKKGVQNPLQIDTIKKYAEYWQQEQEIRRKEAAAPPEKQLPRVKIETEKGDIIVELFENEAPNTVANFISLVEKKFYDGQHFHRVVPHFVVQAGDPATKGQYDPEKPYGRGGPGYTIECECYRKDARRHFRGSLSMAHAGRDTGGSQFFITLQPTPHLNPHEDNRSVHTVFGRVVQGMDVVERIQQGDKIIRMTVLQKRNHPYVPLTSADKKKKSASSAGRKPVEAPKPKAKPKKKPE